LRPVSPTSLRRDGGLQDEVQRVGAQTSSACSSTEALSPSVSCVPSFPLPFRTQVQNTQKPPFRWYLDEVALNATIYSFEINLSDVDRSVYETLAFRVARHPSETEAYLLTRTLAYCLEYREGLSFSKGGLSDPDAPALAVHDLTGALRRWIEVGVPEPARLHRASKASPEVAVYSHKDAGSLLARLVSEKIHRAEHVEIYTFDPEMIASLAQRLSRRMTCGLVITERQIYVSLGEETISGSVMRHNISA
jgi:uncharacterized protein YaeQ